MKKRILPILTVMALGFTSCGGPSLDDVNIAEIKDACGCVDAVIIASDVMLAEADRHRVNGKMTEPDSEAKKVMDEADKKIKDIVKKCNQELKIEGAAMKKCPNFKELEANTKKLENL